MHFHLIDGLPFGGETRPGSGRRRGPEVTDCGPGAGCGAGAGSSESFALQLVVVEPIADQTDGRDVDGIGGSDDRCRRRLAVLVLAAGGETKTGARTGGLARTGRKETTIKSQCVKIELTDCKREMING